MKKRTCHSLSLVQRLPVELRRVVLRLVGDVPLSDRERSVDTATLMWLRGSIVLIPRVLYVVTPVHTWLVDGTRLRNVHRVCRMQRYGKRVGRMISRVFLDSPSDHWCEQRAPARSMGVYYMEDDAMAVPWIGGWIVSCRRGAEPPPSCLV